MIQRKQTLFLLLSGILSLLTILLDSASILTIDMLYTFSGMGIEDATGEIVMPTWVLFGLAILVTLLSFIAIFLYTRRVLQRRITVLNIFLKVGIYVLGWLYLSKFRGAAEELGAFSAMSITVIAAFPLVAIILDYLAARAIEVDERTIRSINRLR